MKSNFILNPFISKGDDGIYQPVRDICLKQGEPGYRELDRYISGKKGPINKVILRVLRDKGFFVDKKEDIMRQFLLKYVCIELHNQCNMRCVYCQRFINRRKLFYMKNKLFKKLVTDLEQYKKTLKWISITIQNEPTIDPLFVEHCSEILKRGLPLQIATNATRLYPGIIDKLLKMPRLKILCINLPTLDKDAFYGITHYKHLHSIIENIDYLKNKPVADEMYIVVLGDGDKKHKDNIQAIRRRFETKYLKVFARETINKHPELDLGWRRKVNSDYLKGCGYNYPRVIPLQQIYITATGKCILCNFDVNEKFITGDLNKQSIREVMTSRRMSLYRKYIYGIKKAPAAFICRNCCYVKT